MSLTEGDRRKAGNTQSNFVRNFYHSQEIKRTQWIYSVNVVFSSVANGSLVLFIPEDAKGGFLGNLGHAKVLSCLYVS